MSIFEKLPRSLVISSKIFTISGDKSDRKRNIDKFFGDALRKLIYHQLCKTERI